MATTSAQDFYAANYLPVFDAALNGPRQPLPPDPGDIRCRFCGRGPSQVSFSPDAHAVSAHLGNRALFSPNECAECNNRFGRGDGPEDQLAKAILFERALCQIRGRRRFPTFDDYQTLRIETSGDDQTITITDPELFQQFQGAAGILTCKIPLAAASQPFRPIEAAMGLIKGACSICPADLLPTIQPTIDWLAGRASVKFSAFPVLYSFVHGDAPFGPGRVLLLRRVTSEPAPAFWCLVATKNHRFQFFVPFCTEDQGWVTDGRMSFPAWHYPDWTSASTIDWHVWDWSSDETVRRHFDVELAIHQDTIVDPTAQ